MCFAGERLSHERDTELEFHFAETADRLIADGMPEEDAPCYARRLLGNYSIQKERTREMDVVGWLEAVRADVSYGLRQLRMNPGFAAFSITFTRHGTSFRGTNLMQYILKTC